MLFLIEVSPETGFYLFAVATLVSMVLNEGIVVTHRRAIESHGKKATAASFGGSETGDAAAAVVPGGATAATGEVLHAKAPVCLLVERSVASAITWLFVLASPILLIIGLVMPSFALGQEGSLMDGLKWMLDAVQSVSLSVLSGATTYPWPTQATGVLPLQIGYFFVLAMLLWFLIIAPVLLSVCSLVLWAVPLSPSGQKRVMWMSEFMFNWQALDVYAACVIVMFCWIRCCPVSWTPLFPTPARLTVYAVA